MEITWTGKALPELALVYESLANKSAAQALTLSPIIPLSPLRIGEQLFQLTPRDIRTLLAGDDEVRDKIQKSVIYVLHIWHTRKAC